VKCVQKPCEVKVSFPGGKVYSSYSKILFVDAQDDQVWIVKITPFEDALPSKQAVTSLASIVADIEQRFAIPAERSVQEKILGWQPKSATFGNTKSTRIELEETVSLFIELRESNSERDTWFATLSFSYEAPGK
jgi:hypothetical protein